jgi:antitoxin (DNA-binding transcriptional repressor) of toxin-antitoxin stability system
VAEIKAVGVKELKNNLSAYLREVQRGVRILVTDRQRVVAELREPMPAPATSDPLLALAERGVVRLPAAAKRPLPRSPVRLPAGTSQRILDELRRERSDLDE